MKGTVMRTRKTQKQVAAEISATAEVAFKKQLVAARKAAKLSQRRLADLMGVDHSTVSRMERLDSDPRLSDVRRYLTQCKAALSVEVVGADQVAARWIAAEVTRQPHYAPSASPTPRSETSGADHSNWVHVGDVKDYGLAA
ncbi:helix-turn-helix transcriptional regulator [Gordonia rubripertincta]|uniref:Helix-turn-helix transcriptional regulator n=1 Tax=Gordonia rubripertincta TaxID=36822 RepID=A0AAW4G4X4_GORRU|nr:helix-turn-helix transcriptional regulator [Gordonia rubripertincta]MBM7278289.1 helix-turn-helix transcriptional regulator [Gordonia rubripertincta]